MEPVNDHTLHELQIISEKHNENSVLKYFDKTVSYGGRDRLKIVISRPVGSLANILSVKKVVKSITRNVDIWNIHTPIGIFGQIPEISYCLLFLL